MMMLRIKCARCYFATKPWKPIDVKAKDQAVKEIREHNEQNHKSPYDTFLERFTRGFWEKTKRRIICCFTCQKILNHTVGTMGDVWFTPSKDKAHAIRDSHWNMTYFQGRTEEESKKTVHDVKVFIEET